MNQRKWGRWPVLALLGLGALATPPGFAQDSPTPTSATQSQVPAPSGGIWISAKGSPYREALRMTPFIEDAAKLPFTDMILQVRANGDAYYDSKLVPRASGVPDQYDPLKVLLAELKKGAHPKRVIAWFDPYHAGNLNESAALAENHVLLQHQDWLSLREDRDSADSSGDMFLEPGLSAVQQHLEAVVRDLVKNYAIDGLYFDHVGDPAGDGKWGYHPEIVSRWVERKGLAGAPPSTDPEWQAFRAEIMTASLAGLVAAARAERAELPISVGIDAMGAPPATADAWTASDAFKQTHQDFPRWSAIPGISRFYLKDFHAEPSEGKMFDGWMDAALRIGDKQKVQVAVGVSGEINEALDALKQLRRASEAGAGGMALWQYSQPVRDAGSRELFMGAVGRTVLSSEFLRSMETIQRSRTQAINLTMVTKGSASDETSTSAATSAASPGADDSAGSLPLPPPPRVAEVGDEPGAGLPPKIETGEGRLLPVQPTVGGVAAAPPAKGSIDPETMAALDRLTNRVARDNGEPVIPATAEAPTTASLRIQTINEMLGEFLQDPRFKQSIDLRQIWRSDTAQDELKKKFGNIF